MLEQLLLMLLDVEPYNGWKIFPQEVPKEGQWVWVTNYPVVGEQGIRARFTGSFGAGYPPFIDDYGNPVGSASCFWKPL